MKLNIACRETGGQISLEVDDDKKLLPFFEKRLGSDIPADSLGTEFQGYILRITGGNDKQGFPMLQGVLTNRRVRLLFRAGMKCYRARRDGQHRRKSVRGCIVSPDLSALNAVVMKKGAQDIAGLTDIQRPRRLGPKRASKIRRMFNLPKNEPIEPYIPRRVIEGDKKKTKNPKVQRLVTPARLRRKRRFMNEYYERHQRTTKAHEEYKQMIENYAREKRAKTVAAKLKKKQITGKPQASPVQADTSKTAPASKAKKVDEKPKSTKTTKTRTS